MPFSFHSHSAQYCKHARNGSLAEVVEAARTAGYTQFGLSEHMPRYDKAFIYPEEADLGMTCADLERQFEDYVVEARALQAKYESLARDGQCQLEILVGAETEYTSAESVGDILRLRSKHSLDYVVGSIHHVRGLAIDFSKELFEEVLAKHWNGDHQALFSEYFDEQLILLQGVLPEVVGHFDVIRKYCSSVPFGSGVLEKVRRNLQFCADHSLLVEVNSSGIAKGCRRPYPQEDVMGIVKEVGVRLTLGDDAHATDDVALYYGHIRQYLHDMDLGPHVYYLVRESGEQCPVGNRSGSSTPSAVYAPSQPESSFRRVSSKAASSIMDDSFWSRCPSYELAVK